MSIASVLAGEDRYHVEQRDCLDFLRALPKDSVSLVMTSPPYEKCRDYLEAGVNLGIARDTEAWVAWLVECFSAAQECCTGLICMVVAGQTKKFRWSAGPALLMADLHRKGFHLRTPPIFHRSGIPGSGGNDYLRNDYEFCVCTARPGKLPWSDQTACGHPPKWAPGGEMSHRLADGQRVNQWGHSVRKDGGSGGENSDIEDGKPAAFTKMPSHKSMKIGDGRRVTRGKSNGDTSTEDAYSPPEKANPGNCIRQTYTADEVASLLDQSNDIIHCNVGGGNMGEGDLHSRRNEAPFPEKLVEFFVRTFAKPGGIVVDMFMGSATTGHVAIANGRRFLGCDLRESQLKIAQRRLADVTPPLFTEQ
jgi:hypothetical protein